MKLITYLWLLFFMLICLSNLTYSIEPANMKESWSTTSVYNLFSIIKYDGLRQPRDYLIYGIRGEDLILSIQLNIA